MSNAVQYKYSINDLYETFFSRCESAYAVEKGQWCCLAIDIENFKLFNEVYGRSKGDVLLSSVLSILKKMESEKGCVTAYLGRDEFASFMLYDKVLINRLFMELRDAVAALGDAVGFFPVIGVYRLQPTEQISMDMYDKAVSAIKNAKRNHTECIIEYDISSSEKEKNEYQTLVKLRKAVENGRITFYLQPQCRMSTKKIVGAEALARWIEEDGTMISPGVFIPALEHHGFISEFDKYIWELVCKWIRSLLDRGISPVPVSVNISQIDILTMDVAEVLAELCDRYRIPVGLIKAEITESAYAEEFNKVQALVKGLREKGFVIMMDDFGSGYSSLNMLENVSVDVLKLDMNFVKEANLHSRRGVTIVESIVNMAKMMGLPIVVEGIETEEQVLFLRNLGCRYAQGFYFYRPMSVFAFEDLMQEDKLDRRGFLRKMNEQIHVREFLDENTFTDAMLNNVLGAVAFYSLDGKDLTITRFNEQFYHAIADASMEKRQEAIQNYVVKEDWPLLYKALEEASSHVANGASCEIRFYKSDGSIFWFRMHFFYLRNEQEKKIFYGQVEDVTEARGQSLQFFEVLREQSEVSMMINLDQETIQYVTGLNKLSQIGLPFMDLETSMKRTMDARIDSEEDRKRFQEFFDANRLRAAYQKAIYHEKISVGFRLTNEIEQVEFSTYYIRYTKERDLMIYAFVKRLGNV